MVVYKCAKCGENLEVTEELAVSICRYCGAEQSLPQLGTAARRVALKQVEDFLNGDDETIDMQELSDLIEQAQQLEASRSNLAEQEQQLAEKREQLDALASNERQQIDEQLSELASERLEIEAQLQSADQQLKALQDEKKKQIRIKWKTLYANKDCSRVLAITRDCIAKKPYHHQFESITWERCTLRWWLNADFYNSLPEEVKARVVETSVRNPPNPESATPGTASSSTRDKVFLLSMEEVGKLFKDDSARMAAFEGVDSSWWLRTSGAFPNYAARVNKNGRISTIGGNVRSDACCVRPALWISLQSEPLS